MLRVLRGSCLGQAAEAGSYDAAGNRVTANGTAYLTGPNNQLLFDGVYSYLYDPEGNRTARFIDVNANGLLDAGDTAATTYAWDHRNRLTRVTDYATYGDPATRAVDYLYDVENRWIGRDVDLDADGQIDTRTRFAYDGNQIVMQFDRALASTDDPADPLTQDHLSHRYLWNPAAVDQLMADEHVTTDPSSPGTILWPLADHLGTIRDLAVYDSSTDTTTVVNHRTFDAYGNLQSQTNPAVDCLFSFTGRPLDQETSLQNNLHRWYDAKVGRWMSEDPIGFEGRDGNLYGYVGNGPIAAVDPGGLKAPGAKHTSLVTRFGGADAIGIDFGFIDITFPVYSLGPLSLSLGFQVGIQFLVVGSSLELGLYYYIGGQGGLGVGLPAPNVAINATVAWVWNLPRAADYTGKFYNCGFSAAPGIVTAPALGWTSVLGVNAQAFVAEFRDAFRYLRGIRPRGVYGFEVGNKTTVFPTAGFTGAFQYFWMPWSTVVSPTHPLITALCCTKEEAQAIPHDADSIRQAVNSYLTIVYAETTRFLKSMESSLIEWGEAGVRAYIEQMASDPRLSHWERALYSYVLTQSTPQISFTWNKPPAR